MNEIIKESRIREENLSGEQYFLSLLNEAFAVGEIDEGELMQIQADAVERFSEKARSYTHGESSSVRTEDAEIIMSSVLYTVGVYLKSLPTPIDAVSALRRESFRDLYMLGRKKIGVKLATIKKIAEFLAQNAPKSRAIYYRQATKKLSARFFSLYNPDFAAHDAAVLPDYPLLVPVCDLVGVEYMQKYLEGLYSETQLLRLFSPITVDTLLYASNNEYPEAPDNILRPVFLAALGSVLTGKDVLSLMGGADIPLLYDIFDGKSKAEILATLQSATTRLLENLHIGSPSLARYLHSALPDISAEILSAIETKTLHMLFLSPVKRDPKDRSLFRFGTRMDDDLYSSLIAALESTEDFSERHKIIKEKIHSMYDLEDVLTDIPFSEKETATVLSALKENEWAFLAKKHPEGDEDLNLRSSVKQLRRVIWEEINKKTSAEKERILDTTLLISNDIFEM